MMRIRKATDSDAQRIAEIYVETWRTTYAGSLPDRVLIGMSQERQSVYWSRAIRNGGELVFVAEDTDAGVIAVGSAGPNRSRGNRYKGEVYTLYVHPDFQNQGVGALLLGRLFDALAARGLDSALIWVLAPNPARFFYERMGGMRVGDRDEKLWGTTLKEIAYGWPDLHDSTRSGRSRV